jgi:hypothetical protein
LHDLRPPTHVVTIEVPLSLDDPPLDYSPVQDAVRVCLAVSRAGYSGHLSGDAQVSIAPVDGTKWATTSEPKPSGPPAAGP